MNLFSNLLDVLDREFTKGYLTFYYFFGDKSDIDEASKNVDFAMNLDMPYFFEKFHQLLGIKDHSKRYDPTDYYGNPPREQFSRYNSENFTRFIKRQKNKMVHHFLNNMSFSKEDLQNHLITAIQSNNKEIIDHLSQALLNNPIDVKKNYKPLTNSIKFIIEHPEFDFIKLQNLKEYNFKTLINSNSKFTEAVQSAITHTNDFWLNELARFYGLSKKENTLNLSQQTQEDLIKKILVSDKINLYPLLDGFVNGGFKINPLNKTEINKRLLTELEKYFLANDVEKVNKILKLLPKTGANDYKEQFSDILLNILVKNIKNDDIDNFHKMLKLRKDYNIQFDQNKFATAIEDELANAIQVDNISKIEKISSIVSMLELKLDGKKISDVIEKSLNHIVKNYYTYFNKLREMRINIKVNQEKIIPKFLNEIEFSLSNFTNLLKLKNIASDLRVELNGPIVNQWMNDKLESVWQANNIYSIINLISFANKIQAEINTELFKDELHQIRWGDRVVEYLMTKPFTDDIISHLNNHTQHFGMQLSMEAKEKFVSHFDDILENMLKIEDGSGLNFISDMITLHYIKINGDFSKIFLNHFINKKENRVTLREANLLSQLNVQFNKKDIVDKLQNAFESGKQKSIINIFSLRQYSNITLNTNDLPQEVYERHYTNMIQENLRFGFSNKKLTEVGNHFNLKVTLDRVAQLINDDISRDMLEAGVYGKINLNPIKEFLSDTKLISEYRFSFSSDVKLQNMMSLQNFIKFVEALDPIQLKQNRGLKDVLGRILNQADKDDIRQLLNILPAIGLTIDQLKSYAESYYLMSPYRCAVINSYIFEVLAESSNYSNQRNNYQEEDNQEGYYPGYEDDLNEDFISLTMDKVKKLQVSVESKKPSNHHEMRSDKMTSEPSSGLSLVSFKQATANESENISPSTMELDSELYINGLMMQIQKYKTIIMNNPKLIEKIKNQLIVSLSNVIEITIEGRDGARIEPLPKWLDKNKAMVKNWIELELIPKDLIQKVEQIWTKSPSPKK